MNVKRPYPKYVFCALIIFAFSHLGYASASQFRLLGTAIFQGDASALIENTLTGEQKFIDINDSVDGYLVREILSEKVVLESEGKRYELASATLTTAAASPTPTIQAPVVVKQAPAPEEKNTVSTPKPAQKKKSALQFSLPMAGRFVSGFGSRKDPWGGGTKTHNGVDIAAPQGTRIRAAADGTVKEAAYKGLLGRHVIIDHGNGYETVYAHMYRLAVKAGQEVSSGDVIGYEGSTGRSTGPHLHFEVRKNGTPVNPGSFVSAYNK